MSKSILRQLYEGEIYPSENIGYDNPQIQKFNGLLSDEKKKFMDSLLDNAREDFHKLDDLQNESAALYAYESFVHGYKLGITLLFEALCDSKGLARNSDN